MIPAITKWVFPGTLVDSQDKAVCDSRSSGITSPLLGKQAPGPVRKQQLSKPRSAVQPGFEKHCVKGWSSQATVLKTEPSYSSQLLRLNPSPQLPLIEPKCSQMGQPASTPTQNIFSMFTCIFFPSPNAVPSALPSGFGRGQCTLQWCLSLQKAGYSNVQAPLPSP